MDVKLRKLWDLPREEDLQNSHKTIFYEPFDADDLGTSIPSGRSERMTISGF